LYYIQKYVGKMEFEVRNKLYSVDMEIGRLNKKIDMSRRIARYIEPPTKIVVFLIKILSLVLFLLLL
jgi:hypothetical protein